jgi:hypothetical protein
MGGPRMTGILTFRINAADVVATTIPLQVRNARGVRVDTILSSRSLKLPVGNYFVSGRLPDGTRLSGEVSLREGATANVELSAESPEGAGASGEAPAPNLGLESTFPAGDAHEFGMTTRSTGLDKTARKPLTSPSLPEGARPRTTIPQEVNQIAGNVFAGALSRSSQPAPAQIVINGSDHPLFLELKFSGQEKRTYIALPTAPGIGCTADAEFGPFPSIHLQNKTANDLLRYQEAGLVRQAKMLAVQSDLAEALLAKKFDDPVAAAVGGYALLRTGEMDRLHDWTENLATSFPTLPDGLVIFAEHLAWSGRHLEALRQLLKIPERGLPLFSFGLSRAIDRLRLYASSLSDGGLSADEKTTEAVRSVLEKLQAIGSVCTFEYPFTNFIAGDVVARAVPN